MTKAPKRINLDFRPATYFWPLDLETHLLSHVKGTQRRTALKAAIASNEFAQVFELLGDLDLPDEMREALFSIHPEFLGGEFLPDRAEDEVEAARITIASTTSDVTSVFVRFDNGLLHYRVLDEYEGETLSGPAACTSDKPLTLGELVEFLDCAWPLMDVLEMNCGGLRDMLRFFQAESAFYPQIDALYRRRVREAYRTSAV